MKTSVTSREACFLPVHPPHFVLENASTSRRSTIVRQGIWIRHLWKTSPPPSATTKHIKAIICGFLSGMVCFEQIPSKTMRCPILAQKVFAGPHFTRTRSPELSRAGVFLGGRDSLTCTSTKKIIEVAEAIGVANLRKRIIFPTSKFGLVDSIILESADDKSTFLQFLLSGAEFCHDVIAVSLQKSCFSISLSSSGNSANTSVINLADNDKNRVV